MGTKSARDVGIQVDLGEFNMYKLSATNDTTITRTDTIATEHPSTSEDKLFSVVDVSGLTLEDPAAHPRLRCKTRSSHQL